MADILVIGGTRFVGRQTAIRLASGNRVLVLSRNNSVVPGAERLVADRAAGLRQLAGRRFDVVVDFLAYTDSGVEDAAALGDAYLSISSTWMAKLPHARNAKTPADQLPQVTREYLHGKERMERAVLQLQSMGRHAAVVRLPIMLGGDDHTGRLAFYRGRVADAGPVLLVDGGINRAHVLWSDDAARVLAQFVEAGLPGALPPYWDVLPEAVSVEQFVREVASAANRELENVPASYDTLARELPQYLANEPLWRERELPLEPINLFNRLGCSPTSLDRWLKVLPPASVCADPGRPEEIALARRLSAF